MWGTREFSRRALSKDCKEREKISMKQTARNEARQELVRSTEQERREVAWGMRSREAQIRLRREIWGNIEQQVRRERGKGPHGTFARDMQQSHSANIGSDARPRPRSLNWREVGLDGIFFSLFFPFFRILLLRLHGKMLFSADHNLSPNYAKTASPYPCYFFNSFFEASQHKKDSESCHVTVQKNREDLFLTR